MTISTNFLTYEQKRKRFVFQLRIPANLRTNFNGRTTLRKSLGNIPYEQAVVRAHELATQYLAEFSALRPAPADVPSAPVTVLKVTAETGHQFSATWQHEAISDLTKQLARLQTAPETEWEKAIDFGQVALKTAREQLRRSDFREFHEALAALQRQHGFTLNGDTADLAFVARQFNAARVSYLASVLHVLAGTQGVDALNPSHPTSH
ncbi:DUF6538 domain-containing protein [Propionivibrio sp.]|uniref:DUF6538 domain-containing protein n=1 Tax=Propionivibrio sp. TaxID=2212460 RepID=UPI003BEFBA25